MTQHTDLPSDLFPTTVREFFTAHVVRDVDTASSLLAGDAAIVERGETLRDREEAHAFLRDAGYEFEYATEQIGARRVDDAPWVGTVRLGGTFPGGVTDSITGLPCGMTSSPNSSSPIKRPDRIRTSIFSGASNV